MSHGSHCHTHKQLSNALSLYSGNQTDILLIVGVMAVMMVTTDDSNYNTAPFFVVRIVLYNFTRYPVGLLTYQLARH